MIFYIPPARTPNFKHMVKRTGRFVSGKTEWLKFRPRPTHLLRLCQMNWRQREKRFHWDHRWGAGFWKKFEKHHCPESKLYVSPHKGGCFKPLHFYGACFLNFKCSAQWAATEMSQPLWFRACRAAKGAGNQGAEKGRSEGRRSLLPPGTGRPKRSATRSGTLSPWFLFTTVTVPLGFARGSSLPTPPRLLSREPRSPAGMRKMNTSRPARERLPSPPSHEAARGARPRFACSFPSSYHVPGAPRPPLPARGEVFPPSALWGLWGRSRWRPSRSGLAPAGGGKASPGCKAREAPGNVRFAPKTRREKASRGGF